MLTDPEFLKFLIQEKEQQKQTATPDKVRMLNAEIREASRLLREYFLFDMEENKNEE